MLVYKCLVLFGCGGRAKNLFDKKRKKNLRNRNIRPKDSFAEKSSVRRNS